MNDPQQSYCQDTAEYRLLTRGIYSPKPLYFINRPVSTPKGYRWIVADSLKEIGAQVNFQPSPEGIRDFLCYGFVPAPRSIFKEVSAVPPGMSCSLGIADGQITWQTNNTCFKSAYSAPENAFWPKLCLHTKRDQAALLLSGGLDSAMVAAAAKESGTTLSAYHARFSGIETEAGSDTHAARLTAKHLGLAYREICLDSLSAMRWFGNVVDSLDQPLGDPVVLPFYLLFKAIRRHQPALPVLTGEGGDQIFGSWSMKPMIMREFYQEADYCRHTAYLEGFHKFSAEWPDLISDTLKQQLDSQVQVESPIRQAFIRSPSTDFCDQIRWVDLQLKGLQHIAPRIEAMAAAQQLRLQHPFFAEDLINLGLSLPGDLKFTGIQDKVLLKQLAHNYLPAEVIERRKQGMGVPTSAWFQRGLRPLAAYWLNPRRLAKSGLLNPDTVTAIRQHTLVAGDARSRRWGDRLWMLCILESWFDKLR